jgi:uncharacterized membrane protein
MLALEQTLQQAVADARSLADTHGFWMAWNLLLAFVPVVLAFVLFKPGSRRTPSWWFGTTVFVLFLPNAPYVVTDVVHLFEDIRYARSDLVVLGELVPLYTLFIAIGFVFYVLALDRLWRYVRAERPAWRWWPIELALQAMCAVGVYLGRVVRLNSWQVFTRPREVLSSADWLVGPFPFALILCTMVALIVGTMLTRAVMYSAVRSARRLESLGHSPG